MLLTYRGGWGSQDLPGSGGHVHRMIVFLLMYSVFRGRSAGMLTEAGQRLADAPPINLFPDATAHDCLLRVWICVKVVPQAPMAQTRHSGVLVTVLGHPPLSALASPPNSPLFRADMLQFCVYLHIPRAELLGFSSRVRNVNL